MRKFDLYRYIQKGKYWIILLSILAGVGFILLASNRQTYTAKAVIEYAYDLASSGKTPNGNQLDVSEIKSSKVIQGVIDQFGLNDSVDAIRGGISIQGYVSQDEETLKEALLKIGTEYSVSPTVYVVSYSVGSSKSRAYAQDVLDALISNYISYFGEKYVSESTIPNNASVISNETYDYLEKADLLDSHITDVLYYMEHKPSDFLPFRPICASCSFQDIYDTYQYIQDFELPYLYVEILNNRFSRDLDLLLSCYRQRVETGKVDQEFFGSSAAQMKEIMETFAEKSKSVDRGANGIYENQTDGKNSYAFILSDVYASYDHTGAQVTDRTTTYDYLINRYAVYLINQSDLEIDEAYNQSILQLYSSGASAASGAGYDALDRSIGLKLQRISAELDSLYQRLYSGVSEYNDVRGSDNLRMRTSVTVKEGMNIKLYAILVAAVFFVLTSAVVILVGRLGDFVEYSFWTDHMTKLPNRHRCDQYIEEMSNRMLPEHFTCLMLKVTNIRTINDAAGREYGNQILLHVGELLKRNAPENAAVFYNGNETYIVFMGSCDEARAMHLLHGIRQQIELLNEQRKEIGIEYRIGFAESSSGKIFEIRKLLSEAFRKI